jgi:hypothetical protein
MNGPSGAAAAGEMRIALHRHVLKRSVALWGERHGGAAERGRLHRQPAGAGIPHATCCRALGIGEPDWLAIITPRHGTAARFAGPPGPRRFTFESWVRVR